jgi:YesN/AraC family two-component response regulator
LVEEKLKKEHLRLETVKDSFRNYGEYARQIIQNNIDRFMDSLLNRLLHIDKKNKRNHEKLDGLLRQIKKHSDNAKLGKESGGNDYLFRDVSAVFQKD